MWYNIWEICIQTTKNHETWMEREEGIWRMKLNANISFATASLWEMKSIHDAELVHSIVLPQQFSLFGWRDHSQQKIAYCVFKESLKTNGKKPRLGTQITNQMQTTAVCRVDSRVFCRVRQPACSPLGRRSAITSSVFVYDSSPRQKGVWYLFIIRSGSDFLTSSSPESDIPLSSQRAAFRVSRGGII